MSHKKEGVLSDEDIQAMRDRNQQKAEAVIAAMGVKYVCHPANMLRKNPRSANFVPAAQKPAPGVLQLRQKGSPA